MNSGIKRLVLIDSASRLATRIINGRRTTTVMPVTPATTPEQIEAFRTADPGQTSFHRIAAELQSHDIK